MTTSQQRHGRHARLDGPADPGPLVPSPRPQPDAAARTPGAGVGPGFGEWPYGSRTPEEEPVGPNPYLPSEGAAPDAVALPPGGWPGTVALVVGVVGLALAAAPITAVVVWPLIILGLVLGVAGVRRIRRGTARNGVAAVIGTLLCAVGLAACAAWIAAYTLAGLNTWQPGATPAGSVVQQVGSIGT